jgi:multicomponent Na+:H+ antiporter subunit C
MLKFIIGHYGYWFIFVLLTIGLFGMLIKRNLVKKLIGMTIFQTAVIIFFVASSSKWGGTVPVLDPNIGVQPAHTQTQTLDHHKAETTESPSHDHSSDFKVDSSKYINPLPHTLMLTAIVVGVATTGVAFALIITIFRRFKTLEEDKLLEGMKEENDTE